MHALQQYKLVINGIFMHTHVVAYGKSSDFVQIYSSYVENVFIFSHVIGCIFFLVLMLCMYIVVS